ncbi:MAG: hypothetical protein ACI8W8_003514, partial [Rhodothermales bacterium]
MPGLEVQATLFALLRSSPFLLLLLTLSTFAQAPAITVKLVTDFESQTLISSKESLTPITETVYTDTSSHVRTVGTRSELWIRNAHVDGKYFFETFFKGKYIGRDSSLLIPREELAPGPHIISPGDHRFEIDAAGGLSSADPEIRIDGDTVLLRCHRVTLYAVDGAKTGPPNTRTLPSKLLLFSTDTALELDPDALPKPKSIEGQLQGAAKPGLIYNALSHAETFYPLSIWLPANQRGKGYLSLPSWQTFHVTPAGTIDLQTPVPGIVAESANLIIPYRKMRGRVNSVSSLSGLVGPLSLVHPQSPGETELLFGATIEPIVFKAGFGGHAEKDLALSLDRDLSRSPHKYFLADNLTANTDAIRLLLGEWEKPVLESGQTGQIRLRLSQSPDQSSVEEPVARVAISAYRRESPAGRDWQPVTVRDWSDGTLSFDLPDLPFGFYVLRIQVDDAKNSQPTASLSFEIPSAIVPSGQVGSAAFSANKGRDAFVCGEDIRLRLILRTPQAREPSDLQINLTLPDGQSRPLTLRDQGLPWQELNLRIPAALSEELPAGRYALSIDTLPAGVAAYPFGFDLVSRDRSSEYLVVKTSKYTRPMTNLLASHWDSRHPATNIDRAVKTLAELGYNRIDNMQYTSNHHLRPNKWREELAQSDPRLPAPAAVYTPSPRNQMLNACVREKIEFSDVLAFFHDFHLPRYVEGYILACERWLAREVQAMRHSPAMDGMMLYDEMYDWASDGMGKNQQKIFSSIRERVGEETLGMPLPKIETEINRYVVRPKAQRNPQALQDFLRWGDWVQHGWGDWTSRMAAVGKSLAPQSRYGTYHRTFMGAGGSDFIQNGYAPDIFKDLDIISHVHYADNSTCWVNIPMLAPLLRSGTDKSLYINLPVAHESRTKWDGQFQRHMAFALMAQGANGIAMWGLPASFHDDANPGTMVGMETTRLLNKTVIQPFGPVIDHTVDGYRKVGIVSTLNQHIMSPFKANGVANQTELIWVALWRLGYAPVFIREAELDGDLRNFEAIFVPGVFFDGELSAARLDSLKAAIAAGSKVIVEKGSELALPGIIRLDDYAFDGYALGKYFATWNDDELDKIYSLSQRATDYLAPKMQQWGIEPAARGPFRVGPNWRQSEDIHYLIMANFEDPDYGHTVKQQMAKPVLMPLSVPARHGNAAYDLLRETALPLGDAGKEKTFALDMRRIQGGIVAFLPQPVQNFELNWGVNAANTRLQLSGVLHGAKPITGAFPVTIRIGDAEYHRVLGDGPIELQLPGDPVDCEVRECI